MCNLSSHSDAPKYLEKLRNLSLDEEVKSNHPYENSAEERMNNM